MYICTYAYKTCAYVRMYIRNVHMYMHIFVYMYNGSSILGGNSYGVLLLECPLIRVPLYTIFMYVLYISAVHKIDT